MSRSVVMRIKLMQSNDRTKADDIVEFHDRMESCIGQFASCLLIENDIHLPGRFVNRILMQFSFEEGYIDSVNEVIEEYKDVFEDVTKYACASGRQIQVGE